MSARDHERGSEAGFTLIEALVALALTGLVLSALATLTAQYMPNWNRGIDRIQHTELVGISMQRIAADLAATEFITPNRDSKKPLFEGTPFSVTFIRTAIGPNAGIGLDVVRIGEITDHGHPVTVRTRTSFAPLPKGVSTAEQLHLVNPVVLLQAPQRLSFAYAGPDRVFQDNWHDADKLPVAIRLTVRDAASQHVLAVSTVTPVHVDAPSVKDKDKDGTPDDSTDARVDPNDPMSSQARRGGGS